MFTERADREHPVGRVMRTDGPGQPGGQRRVRLGQRRAVQDEGQDDVVQLGGDSMART